MYLIIVVYIVQIVILVFAQPGSPLFYSAIVVLAAAAVAIIKHHLALGKVAEQLRTNIAKLLQNKQDYPVKNTNLQHLRYVSLELSKFTDDFFKREHKAEREVSLHKAILESMVEVVIVVDQAQKILEINQAGFELLALEPETKLRGKNIVEVISNAELQRFIHKSITSDRPIDQELILYGDPERIVRAYGRNLGDTLGRNYGSLVVLNDITQIKRLETIRRDFVANVSHELKTPITSIKGFVETLIDGAVENKDECMRFLEIIARQADRLNAIIEDLLSLSRIEQGHERGIIELTLTDLNVIIKQAIENCRHEADLKNVQICLGNFKQIVIPLNASLMEQAIVNLINNAIKYSKVGSKVTVETDLNGNEVLVRVIDLGSGIDKIALPRIFERFYRTDKARSRKEGGTGLGLAIVKHIVQAHHGSVSVESVPGSGSTFVLHLPILQDQPVEPSKQVAI